MPNLKPALAFAATFALGVWAGMHLGHSPNPAASTTVNAAKPATSTPVAAVSTAPTAPAPISPSVTSPAPPDLLNLLTQPASPARNDALIAALEQLAEQNPARALEIARAESNERLRGQLMDAVFRGWGKTNPYAAADWIASQPAETFNYSTAVASLFKGAVANPDTAVALAQRLISQSPDQARDYGDALIYAFAQAGNFQRAADFAASTDSQHRTEWLSAAYGSWANYQPENAAAGALAIENPDVRSDALNAVIAGWEQIDPKGLANFAVNNLPDSFQKTQALSQSLVQWAAENPTDAANWLNQFGTTPDFDSGKAAIATQQDAMKDPSLAIDWAKTISDPDLRSRTITAVVETWTLSDPAGALHYVQDTPDLRPDDRAGLLAKFATPNQ